jgi:hypothetical protein
MELFHQPEAVQRGRIEARDDDLRMELRHEVCRSLAVRGFPDHGHIGLGLQPHPQASYTAESSTSRTVIMQAPSAALP